jgi:hypothetical protein
MKKRAIRIRKPNATKVKKAGAEMDVAYNGFLQLKKRLRKSFMMRATRSAGNLRQQ